VVIVGRRQPVDHFERDIRLSPCRRTAAGVRLEDLDATDAGPAGEDLVRSPTSSANMQKIRRLRKRDALRIEAWLQVVCS
jgi:hypothetical protein